jgi:hypothetical protein
MRKLSFAPLPPSHRSKSCYSKLVVDNVAFDVNTNQIFFNGYNETTSRNGIYEWLPATGTTKHILDVPGIVKVAINTYSSTLHLFFLTIQTDCPAGLCNTLIAIDTMQKAIVAKVLVDVLVDIYDYKTQQYLS